MIFRRRLRSSTASSPRPSRPCSDAAISSAPPEARPSPSARVNAMWPDRRLLDLFKTEFPIVQAPMAGIMDAELVIAAAQGGALGSLPCAMLTAEKAREQVNIIRQQVSAPLNMNYFCHKAVEPDPAGEAGWRQRLAAYYKEFGVDPAAPVN